MNNTYFRETYIYFPPKKKKMQRTDEYKIQGSGYLSEKDTQVCQISW